MLKDSDFKYQIRSRNGRIYSVALRYDKQLTKATGCKSYACSLRDACGLVVAVESISGARDKTQALIWLQYKELCQ